MRARAMTVILSETLGPGMSSMVQAEGDNAQTSPSSRAARIMGSTMAGRRSFSRCIWSGSLRIMSGGMASRLPSSSVAHSWASGFMTSCRLCNVGFL